MIVFDLHCSSAHVFEAWFGSSGAYEDQRARGLLVCPICADTDVTKAVMAPNVTAKGNRATTSSALRPVPSATPPGQHPSPVEVKAALRILAQAQATMLSQSTWVGRDFAATAREMHDGAVDPAPIHGQATLAEAKALVEEGVAIAPLPLPVVPPETVN